MCLPHLNGCYSYASLFLLALLRDFPVEMPNGQSTLLVANVIITTEARHLRGGRTILNATVEASCNPRAYVEAKLTRFMLKCNDRMGFPTLFPNAGNSIALKMAMIAMTTSNSINVKAQTFS